MATFPQFSRLPGELRDLIWDAVATRSPLIHFFHCIPPHSAKWIDCNMLLAPDGQSGARGLVHLSLTCRAAHAAVLRRALRPWQNTRLNLPPHYPRETEKNKPRLTILRVTPYEADRTVNLALDLNADIVVFGGPGVGRKDADKALDWGEWSHILFSTARRFAVRYQPAWDGATAAVVAPRDHGPGGQAHLLWPDCLHLSPARARTGAGAGQQPRYPYPYPDPLFCARCVANVIRRFADLEEFFLIVDGEEIVPTRRVVKEVLEEEEEGMGLLDMDPERMWPPGREFYGYEDVL